MSHDFDEAIKHLPQYELPAETRERHLALLAIVAASSQQRRRRRRLALIATGVVVALGAGGVGTAAALGAFSAEPSDRTEAQCYAIATTDLDNPAKFTSVMVAGIGPTGELGDAAASAIDLCGQLWRFGAINTSEPWIRPVQPNAVSPVPELTACVLESGQVGVFPGDEKTCIKLGLAVAELETARSTAGKTR